MTKKVYSETVKKLAVRTGIPGVVLIGLIFWYLISIDAISDYTFSGDSVCEGRTFIDNPCYAYINFTANEDIFIYPIGYDPWGRNTIMEFSPDVKDWRLQRSWGSGWRTIPLDKSCTGTWCGLSSSKDERKFSVAFRKGKRYNLRIVATKNDPRQTIKWGAFDGLIDPVWNGTKGYIIDRNSVYINTSKVYINVTPHTMNDDGWVELNFVSKIISGDVDVLFGFNTTQVIPKNPYVQKINQTVINETPINLTYWKGISVDNILNKSYDGKDTWYIIKNFNILAGKEYKIKYFLKIMGDGKYDVAIKLSSDSIQQAIDNNRFLFIDPWWNDTTMINTNCTINEWEDNGSSTVGYNTDGSLRLGFLYEDNMISYWNMNTNGSVPDEKCLNDGTNNDATYTNNGKIFGAYDFNGSTDYIQVSNSISGIKTVEMWFYNDANITLSVFKALYAGETATVYPRVDLGGNIAGGITNEMVTLVTASNTAWWWNSTQLGTSIINVSWHHMVFVWNASASNYTLYFEGNNKGNAQRWGSPAEQSVYDDFRIGRNGDGYWDGKIDEVRIYNRSLTSSEVSTLYNSDAGIVYNTSAIKYHSVINTTSFDINWIESTLNCTKVASQECYVKVSPNNRTGFSRWLTDADNDENISIAQGNKLSFDINLTGGNATSSPLVTNFGLLSGLAGGVSEGLISCINVVGTGCAAVITNDCAAIIT